MEFRLFPRLKGLFSKWYCPRCKKILKRSNVKYKSGFRGYYSEFWFMCLSCGNNRGVKTVNEKLEEMILESEG